MHNCTVVLHLVHSTFLTSLCLVITKIADTHHRQGCSYFCRFAFDVKNSVINGKSRDLVMLWLHQNFYVDKVVVSWPNSSSKLAYIRYIVTTQCQQHVSARHMAVPESQLYISCTYVKMQYPGHVDNICCIICGYWDQHTSVLPHCPLFIVLCQNLSQIPTYSSWILQWLLLTLVLTSSYQGLWAAFERPPPNIWGVVKESLSVVMWCANKTFSD